MSGRHYHDACRKLAAYKRESILNECRRASTGLAKWAKKPVGQIRINRRTPDAVVHRNGCRFKWKMCVNRGVAPTCEGKFYGACNSPRCPTCQRVRHHQGEQARHDARGPRALRIRRAPAA